MSILLAASPTCAMFTLFLDPDSILPVCGQIKVNFFLETVVHDDASRRPPVNCHCNKSISYIIMVLLQYS